MGRDCPSVLPAKVSVRFQTRRCDGAVSDEVPPWYVSTIDLADVLPDAGTGFDGTKMFYEAALALFNIGDADPSNKAALDALSEQIARNYWEWLQTSFDETYPEVIAPPPNGLMDVIEWGYEIDRVWTRLRSAPYNGEPEELHHHDPANVDCKDDPEADPPVIVTQTPCFEYYGPPASCVGGKAQLTRYRACLVDGLLVQTYISKDTIN